MGKEILTATKTDEWLKLPEKYPNGIEIALGTLIVEDGGGLYGAYRPVDMMPLIAPFWGYVQETVGDGAVARASVVTDIVELRTRGYMTRPLLKRLVPWDRGWSTEMEGMKGWPADLRDSFLCGSDFDWRMPVDDLRSWVEGLGRFYGKLLGKINVLENGDRTVWEVIPDLDLILTWPRNRLYASVGGDGTSLHHDARIRIETGKWVNGISYGELTVLASSRLNGVADIPLLTFGVAQTPNKMPGVLRGLDTRTSDAASSWDRSFGQVVFSSAGQVVGVRRNGRRLWQAQDTQVLLPTIKIPRESLVTLACLPESELSFHDQGLDFLEKLRRTRKILRYWPDSVEVAVKVWDEEMNLETLTNGQEKEATQELLTMVYYAPKETRLVGREVKFGRYFPGWLKIEKALLFARERELVYRGMRQDAMLTFPGKINRDGWHLLCEGGFGLGDLFKMARLG